MTPQSNFMIEARIAPQREAELRQLLASMNDRPGCVKSNCPLIPFHQFPGLHVARLLILDDKTLDDITVYGIPRPTYPQTLVFLGDVDGDRDAFLRELAWRAPDGLKTIFSHCEGFDSTTNLLAWMREHSVPSAAAYVNWRGRTVQRVREEARLCDAIQQHVQQGAPMLKGLTPQQIHSRLRALVSADIAAGRITLSPEGPTPPGWRLRNVLNLLALPLLALLLLLLLPIVLVVAVIALVQLRRLEKSDPELCQRSDPAASAELAGLEDHDVTNQFSAMGTLKPGMLRLWTTILVLWVLDWTARHVYTRGRLARVRSIHFARWVFLNNKQRVIFLSNYDGSLESYMDDFINKVGFGLNVVFSNGAGYPRTDFLFLNGCGDERKFKEYLRRHQLPTQVWYKAYQGLTAVDLERNGRIRQGFESTSMSDHDAREWVALL